AMRGNRDMPHAARIALLLEEVMVEDVQIDDAPGQRADHHRQQRQDQAESPGETGSVEADHGFTRRTSAASGMRICSCSLASVSMRLWAVQVLCSRISRPHSAWARSRSWSSP